MVPELGGVVCAENGVGEWGLGRTEGAYQLGGVGGGCCSHCE